MGAMTIEEFLEKFKNKKHVEQLKKIPQKFNVTHDEESETTNITIYGVIGSSWFSESFSASDIDKALNEAGSNNIIVNLNSPGGDAFDGISIFNRLKRHKGKVTVYVDGYACSAASIIAMAGDEIIMQLGSMMMIHEATSIIWGSKRDMRKEADVLEELEEGLIDIYMTKTNLSRDEVKEKINNETWMSASTAVELGFANEVSSLEDNEGGDGNEVKNEVLTTGKKKTILEELKTVLNKEESKNSILNNFKRR